MNTLILSSTQQAFPNELGNSTTEVVNATTKCGYDALTDRFGIIVQFLLAVISFSCLIVKRFCEPVSQRRTWLVWFYDTSKQGVGAGLIHFANVFLSKQNKDPCIWYVMNFLLDSTIGLLLIYILLRLLEMIFNCCNCKELRNGEYGDPPKCKRWLMQCLMYGLVMVTVKGVVIALMTFNIWKTISEVIVSPIQDAHLEVVLVMFVIPIIVNALIFWVVDNFLMNTLRINSSRTKSHKYSKLKTTADTEDRESIKLKSDGYNS